MQIIVYVRTYNIFRIIGFIMMTPQLFINYKLKSVGKYKEVYWYKNIFFDTLVHDTGSLELLVKNQGSNQVLMGLDDPYPLGEMESAPQSSYPGKILDLAMDRDIINSEQYDQIWEDNVLQWLYGDDEKGKQDLINKISA